VVSTRGNQNKLLGTKIIDGNAVNTFAIAIALAIFAIAAVMLWVLRLLLRK
jgi:hypothetical protein